MKENIIKSDSISNSFNSENKKLSICLVCDFFYPRVGGVEVHVYQLSVALIRRGCKVIILTHQFKNRQGIKYMGNGVKVYYTPHLIMHDDTIAPSLHGFHGRIREILIKEEIDIVHCHQSTSVLGLQCMMHARTMGKHVVYTDHSLFGFDDLACVNLNKVLKSYLTDVDQMITVSSIGKDNLLLRAYIDPTKINVIPNAVDFTKFKPEPKSDKPLDIINIVTISRQTYRKGTDLLIEVIPELCNIFPNVNFLIGGDGNKKILLDDMVQSSNLHNRVKLFGSLPHNKVRDVMVQGHIYLNTSLTEAFCIAIVEAASSGLYVVSTDVGGVGEVLPENMMTLVKAEKSSIIEGVKKAVENYNSIRNQTHEYHGVLKTTYNWNKVANKTLDVYNKAICIKDRSILNRFKNCLSIGRFSGIFYLILIIIDYLLLLFISSIWSKKNYKKPKAFIYEVYKDLLENKI